MRLKHFPGLRVRLSRHHSAATVADLSSRAYILNNHDDAGDRFSAYYYYYRFSSRAGFLCSAPPVAAPILIVYTIITVITHHHPSPETPGFYVFIFHFLLRSLIVYYNISAVVAKMYYYIILSTYTRRKHTHAHDSIHGGSRGGAAAAVRCAGGAQKRIHREPSEKRTSEVARAYMRGTTRDDDRYIPGARWWHQNNGRQIVPGIYTVYARYTGPLGRQMLRQRPGRVPYTYIYIVYIIICMYYILYIIAATTV